MPKIELEVVGKDKASGVLQGLTKNIVGAGVVLEGLKFIAGKIIDVTKDGINAFKEQDLAMQALRDTVGNNITSYTNFASAIQNTTTIGDETTLGIMKYGLQLGVTQEKIQGATKDAIGLSKAFGIDLNQSMKLTALANQGQYDMLARYIPELRNVTDETQKNVIVQQKMADGFKIAQGETETFTGKMKQLENAQSDIYENIGNLVALVGKDFADSMIKGANAINDFLTNAKNVATIRASLSVLGEVVKDIASNAFSKLKEVTKDFAKNWQEMEKSTNVDLWKILGIAVQLVNTNVSILAKFVSLVANGFINLIKVAIEAGRTLKDVFEVLTGKAKWDDVKKQFDETGKAIKDLGKDIISDTGAIFDTAVSEIKKFNTEAKKNADEYRNTFTEMAKKTNEEIASSPIKLQIDSDDAKKEVKSFTAEINDALTNSKSDMANIIGSSWNNIKGLMNNSITSIKKDAENGFKDISSTISSVMQGALESVNSVMEGISSIIQNTTDANLEAVSQWKEEMLAEIDDWISQEEERQGVKEETTSERLQREIDELQKALNKETDITKKTNLQQEINAKQAALKRNAIETQAAEKKKKTEKDAEDETTRIKKENFEKQKAMQIAMVWINAAAGIVGAWAGAAQWPGVSVVAGMALAGVLTGLILTMAGVQTGLIASQQFTGEQGGVIPGTSFTGDKVNVGVNSMERILTPEQNQAFEQMAFNGQPQNREPLLIQVMLDRKVLVEALVQNQKDERIR